MKRLLLGLVAAAAALATPAAAKPPVWIVRDADSEIVIFGSIHVLPPELDWRPAILDRAIEDADDLWFELPMDPAAQAEVARIAADHGALPAGQSLFALLPQDDAARLTEVCAEYGVDHAMIDRLQPWMAEVVLSGAVFAKAGAGMESGVEKTLSAAAPPGVARRAFETPAEQLAVLADAPREEQIASLRQTMSEMEGGPVAYAEMVRAWADGDLLTLASDTLAPLAKEAPALFKRLVVDRNARWAEILKTRLAGSGRTVVVVGTGHLIGKDGVPARLRAAGYRVEGPDT